MSYEIVRGPFILLEVVGMLCKFVNGISFKSVLDRHRFLSGNPVGDAMIRRMNCLQQMMDEVCAGLDPQDPQLQRFFGRVDLGNNECYLAEMLTYTPFITLKHHDLREHAKEICRIWHHLHGNERVWLSSVSSSRVLNFTREGTCPGDLFEQVRALPHPAEYKMELYAALRDFDATMEELVTLVEPLAAELEKRFQKESWMVDEMQEYWSAAFAKISPVEFLKYSYGDIEEELATDHTQVTIAYMNSNVISFTMGKGTNAHCDNNTIVLGSVATAAAVARTSKGDLETVSKFLKILGDKNRLEVLRRLSKSRSYCHELADAMDVDPGNMSRTLTMLHRNGLLRLEREPLINYYHSDREAVHSFLMLVESVIFD